MNTPYYIVYEEKLRRNLDLITRVSRESGAKIIMAFKANALWRTFPIFREYGISSTASSINEMLLANEELHCKAHTYCPAYTEQTIEQYPDTYSKIVWMKAQHEGALTTPCIIRKRPQVTLTAQQVPVTQ